MDKDFMKKVTSEHVPKIEDLFINDSYAAIIMTKLGPSLDNALKKDLSKRTSRNGKVNSKLPASTMCSIALKLLQGIMEIH